MRQWQALTGPGAGSGEAIGGMIQSLGQAGFQAAVLDAMQPLVPAASWSVYRTGLHCRPTLFLSASRGIPDRTRDCWWAYLSGPYLRDSSFGVEAEAPSPVRLCHIQAQEIVGEHRARVYEAHGMAERVSVVAQEDQAVFAVNFYRHEHQPAFSDPQIAAFEAMALPLLELARKHIALTACGPRSSLVLEEGSRIAATMPAGQMRERLLELSGDLTARELDVCVRLLQGLTQDGVAADLGLSLATVKTYRNRAFARLGIHFRNELFARVLRLSPP
ncbi:MAG: LuxR family transcriptional regulator [Ramlibacter sp.]|jgi:DNA-binding CsgD family transcriptional regulator|nr:LuxR family transcriptional regulator [Ramlibacter sp.]MDB5912822.1 LuxR family transcriptional regulator [Ramlibacter sp.]